MSRWIRRVCATPMLYDVLEHCEGGLAKRLDEHRELVEHLRRETPELFVRHPWVEGWLASQDAFLEALAASCPDRQTLGFREACGMGRGFPRRSPWRVSLKG